MAAMQGFVGPLSVDFAIFFICGEFICIYYYYYYYYYFMPLLHTVGCLVLDPLQNHDAANDHQYYIDVMYRTYFTVYNPDQHTHTHTHIYIYI